MAKLTNKVALVTGGTTGIGFATAKLFAEEGAKVVVTGKNPETLAVARKELGDRAKVVAADATKAKDLDALFASLKAEHGRVDVVFANVGGGGFRPLEAADEAYLEELLALNLKSVYLTIQRAVPLLPNGGSIVLNTSVVDVKGFPTTSVYASAKAAVRQLARSLGAELVDRGIRVNAVSPGPITTPIYDKLGLGEHKDGFIETMRAMNPMKRFGTPEEVAKAVLFLASSDASYITGAEIPVDGGLTSF